MKKGKAVFFHPWCENSILYGPGYNPPAAMLQLNQDLSLLPVYFCNIQDALLLETPPSHYWKKQFEQLSFEFATFLQIQHLFKNCAAFSIEKIQTIDDYKPLPWGWSPHSCKVFKDHIKKGLNTTVPLWFEKQFSTKLFSELNGNTKPSITGVPCTTLEQVQQVVLYFKKLGYEKVLLKANLGASGQNQYLHDSIDTLPVSWISNQLDHQFCLIVEPYLDVILDFSIQLDVESPSEIHYKGMTLFKNLSNRQFSESWIGDIKRMPVSSDVLENLLEINRQFETLNHPLFELLKKYLVFHPHQGPLGIDMFLYQALGKTEFNVKEIVEINPRMTMGRISLGLQKIIADNQVGVWKTVKTKVSPSEIYSRTNDAATFGLKTSMGRIKNGIFWVNDPDNAVSVASIMAVGESIENCRKLLDDYLKS